MIAGIDSMVLVYAGIAPSKHGGQSDEVKELAMRAKLLLHKLQRDTIIFPAVSLSEILVPVPERQKGPLTSAISKMFVVPPFDLPAAGIAAELWAKHKDLPADLQYEKRHVLRADTMIVATAKVARATYFYSHDKKCRALAKLAGLEGEDLPSQPTSDMPEALWIMAELEGGER